MAATSKKPSATKADHQNKIATPAKIKSWKQQYGEVYRFRVVKDSKEIEGYFKAPSADTIMAMAEFAESDKAKAMNILYTNTKIEVDPVVDSDDAVRLAMIAKVRTLWKNYSVAVKKL